MVVDEWILRRMLDMEDQRERQGSVDHLESNKNVKRIFVRGS